MYPFIITSVEIQQWLIYSMEHTLSLYIGKDHKMIYMIIKKLQTVTTELNFSMHLERKIIWRISTFCDHHLPEMLWFGVTLFYCLYALCGHIHVHNVILCSYFALCYKQWLELKCFLWTFLICSSNIEVVNRLTTNLKVTLFFRCLFCRINLYQSTQTLIGNLSSYSKLPC